MNEESPISTTKYTSIYRFIAFSVLFVPWATFFSYAMNTYGEISISNTSLIAAAGAILFIIAPLLIFLWSGDLEAPAWFIKICKNAEKTALVRFLFPVFEVIGRIISLLCLPFRKVQNLRNSLTNKVTSKVSKVLVDLTLIAIGLFVFVISWKVLKLIFWHN